MSDPKDTRSSQLDSVPHHVPEEEAEPYDLKKYVAERTKLDPNFPQLILAAADELRKEMAVEKSRKKQEAIGDLKARAEALVGKAKELDVRVEISPDGVLVRETRRPDFSQPLFDIFDFHGRAF